MGKRVDNLKTGQRVLGHAFALATGDSAEAAFQHYTVVPANMVTPIPNEMSFEVASVVPLSLSCAAAALFENSSLMLPLPTSRPANRHEVILIWGGSSSVASSAIQLARACGLDVIATTSPKNANYAKGLGASEVFDYSDPQIVSKLVNAVSGRKCVGAFDTVGANIPQCAEVLSQLGGGHVVATADPPESLPRGVTANHGTRCLCLNCGSDTDELLQCLQLPSKITRLAVLYTMITCQQHCVMELSNPPLRRQWSGKDWSRCKEVWIN